MCSKTLFLILNAMLVAVVATAFVACGNDDDDDGSDPAELGDFGDPCETVDDCEEEWDVCHEFGEIGFACTMSCEEDADCPEGSEGQKCNQQNVCRP